MRFLPLLVIVAAGSPVVDAGATPGSIAPERAMAPAADSVVEQTLKRLTETAQNPYLTWPDYPHYKDEMEGLYGPAEYQLLWFDGDRPSNRARALVEVLQDAEAHGLDPAAYDGTRLAEYLEDEADAADGSQLALIDGALTVSYLRYLSDLHIGRVNPANLHFGYNIEQKKLDLASVVSTALEQNLVSETAAAVEPRFPQYARMREVLADYRELAALDPILVPVTETVHPGDEYEGVAELHDLLVRLGDMPRGAAPSSNVYEDNLAAGVARFQSRHSLEPDSVIGEGTFAALNTPLADRVAQIELTLERLRWLPASYEEPVIVVNIPAFQVWVLDPRLEGQQIALNMRVIVGKALNKQTPAFRGDMEYVVMSPYWNVPYSIAVNELLPGIRRDPNYLSAHRYEIVRDFSWEQRGLPATAENIAGVRSGKLNLRQLPGGRNSLGHVKFIFPNASNVYLHDTPAHELFERTRRDFSHGCIRLERPADLANWVLRNQPEWTPERIAAAMDSDRPTRVDLEKPLPVFIFYTTALAGEERPYFYGDIYGHDRTLASALQVGYPYPP